MKYSAFRRRVNVYYCKLLIIKKSCKLINEYFDEKNDGKSNPLKFNCSKNNELNKKILLNFFEKTTEAVVSK